MPVYALTGGGSTLVIVHNREKNRYLLIKDPSKPLPLFWKFPGGGIKKGESPAEAAIRELEEETGIIAQASDLRFIKALPRSGHTMYVFSLESTFSGLKERGDTGEITGIFDGSIFETKVFLRQHRQIIKNLANATT